MSVCIHCNEEYLVDYHWVTDVCRFEMINFIPRDKMRFYSLCLPSNCQLSALDLLRGKYQWTSYLLISALDNPSSDQRLKLIANSFCKRLDPYFHCLQKSNLVPVSGGSYLRSASAGGSVNHQLAVTRPFWSPGGRRTECPRTSASTCSLRVLRAAGLLGVMCGNDHCQCDVWVLMFV